ncbi:MULTISPECIES: AvrPphF family type III effector [Comamonadaceae]|uniref:AvrPphF family type III effector n=1 Tax=Acidovorax sacchari TaxID=3230736 RepID=UPI0034A1C6E2
MIQHDVLSPRGGHASGASSSALRAALPSPPRNHPSGIGLQDGSYVLKNGRVFPSVNTLPPAERAAFLKKHHPCSQLKLNDDSLLFRVTDRQWVQDGTLSGHPQSGARIRNHFAIAGNPYMPGSFKPVEMDAMHLPDPVLNVMFGPDAYAGAMNYATSDSHVPVMMTLGALRAAGGGEVFLDISARYGQDNDSRALIVTLPEGAKVPVTILG